MEQKIHGMVDGEFILETGTHLPEPKVIEDEATQLPFVSIVLPTWCEEKYIEACLHSIFDQDYPHNRMEILVADGMSPDNTRVIVKRIAADYPQVRLIDNKDRIQSAGLNRGILESRGSIIIRMDAHAEYGRNYVRKCVETLRKTGADNVGGPARPKARTLFQRLVARAVQSRLGSNGATYGGKGKDGYVDTVFPGAFRRETLRRVGLFDPGAITNEDAEINQRIISSGGKIYMSTAIECYYYPRDSIKGLAIQYFRYGRGRARTLLKHGEIMRLGSFLPFAFYGTLLVLLIVGIVFTPALFAALGVLALYLTGLFSESIRIAIHDRWLYALSLPLIFATTHALHACGVAWGLMYYSFNPDWTRQPPPMLEC